MRVENIKLSDLRFKSNRDYGGEGDIKILAEDIDKIGLINAITVKELQTEKAFEVIAGRRRVAAFKYLGRNEIPSCILEGDEVNHADEIAGSENINRLAMHPLDEATVFKKLLENGQTIEELAKRYDRKPSGIWQRIQLLELNDDIKTLFRNGNLSLHSAAMLKSLSDEAQKAFYKQFKSKGEVKRGEEISDWSVNNFISQLDYDILYSFLKDKQCAECKTRTFYGDKTLFPELDDASDSCLNHECYAEKCKTAIAGRIKNLKEKHKSHAAASLIVIRHSDEIAKIMGAKAAIDGVDLKVIPWHWNTEANAKSKGAQPCFVICLSSSGKLEIDAGYWKEAEEISSGHTESPASKRRGFTPIVNMLDLPKAEAEETLNALGERKRLTANGLGGNVRDSVFWRIMEIKKQEFDDPKKVDHVSKEAFLKKHFNYLHGNGKKVFEMFVGKMPIPDIAKLPSEKVFQLLAAMEWSEYELVDPVDFEKGKPSDILKWAGIPHEKLRQLYKEEISRRMPKKKPEKKSADKKQEKPKTPAAKKTTAIKKTAAKKPVKTPVRKAVKPAAKKPQGKGKK
jgi:ParB/RepB/Spo0J family partition protein